LAAFVSHAVGPEPQPPELFPAKVPKLENREVLLRRLHSPPDASMSISR